MAALARPRAWDDREPCCRVEPCVPVATAPPTVWSMRKLKAATE